MTVRDATKIYIELLETGYDLNGDGQLSVDEVAVYWQEKIAPTVDTVKPLPAPKQVVATPPPNKDVVATTQAATSVSTASAAPAEALQEAIKDLSDHVANIFSPAADAPAGVQPPGASPNRPAVLTATNTSRSMLGV